MPAEAEEDGRERRSEQGDAPLRELLRRWLVTVPSPHSNGQAERLVIDTKRALLAGVD